MNKIKLLDRFVIDQITAGETVQRPSSCLKELLENSIDAGATDIYVAFEGAGSIILEVKDNGFGMSKEDAVKCIERHATSKISAINDLYNLRTLGFRGEALASIAAVSKMDIRTCERNADIGTLVSIEGGIITNVESCVCPQGTDIKVKDLFYNIPVRRNFLKSDRTEIKNLIQIFIRVALANAHVSFSVINGGSVLYDLKAETIKSRIDRIFGGRSTKKFTSLPVSNNDQGGEVTKDKGEENPEVLFADSETSASPSITHLRVQNGKFRLTNETYIKDFIDLKIDTDIVKVFGFVSKPEKCRKLSEQYFFVNARFMHNMYFAKAVQNAYTDIIQSGSSPSFFIYLDVPCDSIEVNIHPQKTEIKFRDDVLIFQILQAGVREAIGKSGFHSVIDFSRSHNEYSKYSEQGSNISPSHYLNFIKNRNNDYNPFQQRSSVVSSQSENASSALSSPEHKIESDISEDLFDTSSFDSTIEINKNDESLQVDEKFILYVYCGNLFIINRQYAETCIQYYTFLDQIKNRRGLAHQLLFPARINIPYTDVLMFDYMKAELEFIGYQLKETDQNNTYEVMTSPDALINTPPSEIISQVLSKMRESEYTVKEVMDRHLALIMAEEVAKHCPMFLNNEQRLDLLQRLFKLPAYTFTPDGKRVVKTITKDDLRKFMQNV